MTVEVNPSSERCRRLWREARKWSKAISLSAMFVPDHIGSGFARFSWAKEDILTDTTNEDR